MATRTRTGNTVKSETQYKSKSDFARALMDGTVKGDHAGTHDCVQRDREPVAGHGPTHSVAEVTRIVKDMGYAFAYGVAKRYGLAEGAANRKKSKLVVVLNGLVRVRTVKGILVIDPATGTTKLERDRG